MPISFNLSTNVWKWDRRFSSSQGLASLIIILLYFRTNRNPRLERVVEIYYENYAQLRAVAYSIVCNGEDADDVMQNVILRLVERPGMLTEVNAKSFFADMHSQ